MFTDNGIIKGFSPIKARLKSKGWEFFQDGCMESTIVIGIIKQASIGQRSKNISKNRIRILRFHPFGEYFFYLVGKKFCMRLYKHFFKQDTDLLTSTSAFTLL